MSFLHMFILKRAMILLKKKLYFNPASLAILIQTTYSYPYITS